MSIPLAAISGHGYWSIALVVGLAAALVVAALLASSYRPCEHREVGRRTARGRDQGRRQHGEHPAAEATAPVLGLIVEEAVVQDGYMNALTDGFGGSMSTTTLLVLLTVAADARRRRRARRRADRRAPEARADLGRARHARRRRSKASRPSTCARSRAPSRRSTPSSTSSSARFRASAARPRSSPRGGRDDALVDRQHRPARRGLPRRRVPAERRAGHGAEHRPERRRDREAAAAGSQDLDADRAAADDAGAGGADGRGSRRLRRLARRDHRRRRARRQHAVASVISPAWSRSSRSS